MSIIVGSITFSNGKCIYPKTPENYILVEVMKKNIPLDMVIV